MNLTTADEPVLAASAQQGDQEAFGELIRRHQTAVFNVAYRLLGNRQDAEDAAQEAFIRAYRAFTTFDPARPLAPWLKKIAANVCFNRLAARQPATDSLEEEELAGPEPLRLPDPENAAQAGERNQRIRAEIASLPLHWRTAIELRHFQELSYEEIAAATQRPIGDVKSDLFRARKRLAERLKDL